VRTAVGVAMAALMAAAASYAFSPRATPPLAASALPMARMQLNSVVRSAAGLVAGGELGSIVVSRDEGVHWQRAALAADRQALITQIAFAPDGKTGMAVGHEGWILGTVDGGMSWSELHFDAKNGEPLMSVAMLSARVWVAVGAFGRALRTEDEGVSWAALDLATAGVEDKHLNRIVGAVDGRQWLIVGERGLVLAGDAQGQQWRALPPFYKGSFYNAAALADGGWLVYGMRGNAFRSTDAGASWNKAEVPAPASFFDHAFTGDGRLLLVGQGGLIASSSDGGQHFSLARSGKRATLTGILLRPDGSGWLSSVDGLQAYPPPPAPVAASGAAR
jgi:photosystem II stability/assembly factor-like uncharacterized protein